MEIENNISINVLIADFEANNSFKVEEEGYIWGTDQIELNQVFIFKSYILKFDRQPLRLIFGFYKPDTIWYLYSLKLDINLDDELEEKIKIR